MVNKVTNMSAHSTFGRLLNHEALRQPEEHLITHTTAPNLLYVFVD